MTKRTEPRGRLEEAETPREEAPPSQDAALRANRRLWDEWTAIHEHAPFYDLDAFRRGGVRIDEDEQREIGPVDGLSLLHVQCHFGIDSLSWARLGAEVTGVDFSPRAIELARRLAAELGLRARFIESDVYALPDVLHETFDLVYTANGVLGWLPDVARWATAIAPFVRPGGRLYVREVHPIVQALADEGVEPGELRLGYPYWESEVPIVVHQPRSYADPDAPIDAPVEYGWNHSLGEIVTALAGAGLRIERLTEYPFLNWSMPFLVRSADGRYCLPGDSGGGLPLMFSVLATAPG